MIRFSYVTAACLVGVFAALPAAAQTQTRPATAQPQTRPATAQPQTEPATPAPKGPNVGVVPVGVTPPQGYVIGVDDQLSIRFWGDAQMSVDVAVRSDGKISVPLLNDVQASGLTPEQLGLTLKKAATKYISDPDATVIVREIRSRKVYVLGQVSRQGPIPLNSEMNVLQVLSAAGGLLEYAHKEDVVIIRKENNGRERRFNFNFNDVVKGKNVQQNIQLQPNDTIVVN